MTPDTWWVIALTVLFIVGCATTYLVGFRSGFDEGERVTLARVDRWRAARERT